MSKLRAGYDKKTVLFDVSIDVGREEIVAIIGPNGAGKSTILKVICGQLPAWQGEVRFEGARVDAAQPWQNVARGLTLVPQGRRIFDELTVKENLEIGGPTLKSGELSGRVHDALDWFPVLKPRLRERAGNLSGGEQQMVAVARALVAGPKLLLLDEPSLGLAPAATESLFARLAELHKARGLPMLIVEQRVVTVLRFSDRAYGIRRGSVALQGPSMELAANREELRGLFLSS